MARKRNDNLLFASSREAEELFSATTQPLGGFAFVASLGLRSKSVGADLAAVGSALVAKDANADSDVGAVVTDFVLVVEDFNSGSETVALVITAAGATGLEFILAFVLTKLFLTERCK